MLWAMDPDTSRLKPLLRSPELAALLQLNPEPVCCLVGGAVRNALCGEPVHDFDLATDYDPTTLSRALAAALAGHWFWLDRARRQSRVLLPTGDYVDFAPFRGVDLAADLSERDFTINAIALNLTDPLDRLADPLNGIDDLKARYLRCCSDAVLISDPLRILRGCRFVAGYGLKVLPETLCLLHQATGLLAEAAGERIRNELSLLLQLPAPDAGLHLMAELGLLPEGPLAVLTSRWQTWRGIVHQAGALRARLAALLNEPVSDQLDRLTLLRLAGLRPLLSAGLPLTLSRRNQKLLGLLRQLFADPPRWPDYWQSGTRARLRRLEDWGPDPVLLLLGHWLSSGAAADGLPLLIDLLDLCQAHAGKGIPELLNGADLQKAFDLDPGPELGEMLSQLRSAEWLGVVETREQGLEFLRKLGQKDIDKG